MIPEQTAAEQTPATEPTGPLSIEETIDRWASVPEPQPETPAETTAVAEEASAARDAQGRFVAAEGAEEPVAAETPAEDAGDAPTEETAADAVAEDEPAVSEGEEEAPADDVFVLALPGRREGDADVQVELTGLDAQTRERLAQLRNGYLRGEEIRTARAELDDIADELRTDPAGFVLTAVSPATRLEVAKRILAELAETEEYDTLVETLNAWEEDPTKRQAYREEADANRPDPAVSRQVREIERAVLALVPEGTDAMDAEEFRDGALRRLHHHIVTNNIDALDPSEVPALIASFAQRFGFQAQPSAQGAPQATPARATPAPVSAPAPTPAQIEAAKTHGQKLVNASARRREVATVAPAGLGGTPIASGTPPKGQTIQERLDWYAKQ